MDFLLTFTDIDQTLKTIIQSSVSPQRVSLFISNQNRKVGQVGKRKKIRSLIIVKSVKMVNITLVNFPKFVT